MYISLYNYGNASCYRELDTTKHTQLPIVRINVRLANSNETNCKTTRFCF